METLFSSSGSRVFDAKSCESIVSVVPVRFAFLETLFLSSESICNHSEETKLEISETLKVRVLSSGRNLATAGREDPTPTPHPSGASFNEFEEFHTCFAVCFATCPNLSPGRRYRGVFNIK